MIFLDFVITIRFLMPFVVKVECRFNSLIILDKCILENLASTIMFLDCWMAECNKCCILYFPAPIGVFNSQWSPFIKKSGVFWLLLGTNLISDLKYSNKIYAADISRTEGLGKTFSGTITENSFLDILHIIPLSVYKINGNIALLLILWYNILDSINKL